MWVFDNIKLSLRVERGEGERDAMSTLFKWTNSDSQRHCLLTCNFFCWRGGESMSICANCRNFVDLILT